MSLLESSMMSSFILYCSLRSTTEWGCASDKRRNSETSNPPLRAFGFLTYIKGLLRFSVDREIEIAYQRGELEMVADKDELFRVP